MNKLLFFKNICRLQGDSLLEEISSHADERTYSPKDCILPFGQKPTKVWFLVEGVIRSYSVDEGGKDITDLFISQPGAISNYILFDGIEIFGQEAVTQVRLLEVPGDAVRQMLHDYSELQKYWDEQIKSYAIKYWYLRTVSSGMFLSEQLRWFQSVDPVSYEAANNVQLASFFGVSRESISRTKAEMKAETEEGNASSLSCD